MMFAEDKVECMAVRNIGLDEICADGNGMAAAVGKIIEDDDFESLSEELRGYDAADVASTSGNQDAIGHGLARSLQKLVPTSGTLIEYIVLRQLRVAGLKTRKVRADSTLYIDSSLFSGNAGPRDTSNV